MGMRRLLIDTNIYSYALRGDDVVVEVLRKAEEIGFSVISIGELLSGFKGGGRDEDTSEFYAEILNNLRGIGRPVPTNDIWIAAVAFQNGLKLFTKDMHFKAIAGLSLVG